MWLFSGWDQATAPCKPCALANISTDTVRVDVSMLQKEDETQPLTAVQEVWATRFPDFFTQDLQQPVKSGSLQSQGKETPKVPSSLDSQRVPPGVSMHESSETEEELPMSDVASPDAQSCSLAQRRLKGIGPRIKGEAAATMGTALGWLSCADVVLEIFGICHCKGPRKRYKWLQRRQPPRRWGWLSKCWLTWEELRALKMRPPRFDELCSLLQLSKTPVLSRVHVNSPATLGPKLVVSAWIRKDRSPASSKYGGNRGTSRRLKTQARSLIKKLRERESRPGSASEQLETFMKNSLAADEAILQQLGTQGPATTVTIKRTVPSLPRVSAEPPSLRAWRRQWAQPVTADSFQIEAKELTKLKTSLHELQGEVQQLHDLMQEETNEFLHGVSSIKEALQLRRAETRQNSLELTSQKPVPPVPVIKKKVHAGGSGTDVKPLPKALLQRLSRVGQEPEPCSTVTLAQVGQLIIEWLSASSAFSFGSVCCKVALALHTGEGLRIWPHLAVPMWLFREVLWKGVSPNHVRSISVYGATDEVIGQQDLKAALASPSQLKLLRFRCSSRGSEAAIQKRNKHGDSMGLGDDGATVLIAAAQKQDWWSRLSSLDFAWNHLCTSALETLEHSWPAALSSLCLDWNGIGPEGSRFLARALAKPNLLRSLDLRSNPLQDEGVLCICKALASCPLKWLGLGETMLTDNGAELAVKELQGHPCLNGIDLGENSLTDRACTSLAEFIQQTPGLKQLYLRGYLFEPTRISDVGGEVLAQAVSCKEGFELELDYQQVGCKTAAALAKNSLWSRVSLFNTNVSTMGALGLANAFRNGVAQGAGQKWLNVAQCRIAPSAIKLLRSVRVLSRFRHPHLVTLMGFGQREGEKYLVYELMPGGDVEAKLRQSRAWLEKQKQSGVPASLLDGSEAQRLHVALGAAKGLAHMVGSTPKTFHRDIKPANILLDADGTPKMADFGLAAAVKDNGAEDRLAVNEIAGTPGYTCLSYIDSRHVTEESEVYSLGIVLLELLVNIPPALASNQGDMVFPLLEAVQPYVEGAHGRLMQCLDLGAFWPQQVAEEFGDLALGCLDPKTKRRPSFVVRSLQRLTSLNPRNPRRSMVKIEDPNMLGASSPSDGGTAGSPEGDTQAGGFGGTLITLHAIAAYRACIELRLAWLVAMNTFGCLMKTRNSYLDEEMQDPRSFIQQIQYCMDRVAKDAKSDFKHTLQKAVKTAKEQGYFEPICTQRHLSVRHYTFDVFKYCGDIVHVLALVLCLAVILRDNGTGGISFKTHILYFIVFTARFSNVLFCDQSIYLVLLWSATLKIVLLLYIFGASIDEKDTVSLAAALFMIIVMTLVFGVYSLEDHGLFVEILWIFSTYLESISMLPQYIYCYRDVDNKCPLVSAYVFAMGGYQMVFGVSWAHHFFFRPYELDVSSMISGFLGIVFFCDYLTFRVMGVSMLVQVCISVDDTIKEAEAGFCEICI
eukprot:symbB.v1.2.011403.t1/scaffold764.1/size165801/9